jgi:hypothetical protein
MPFAGSLFDSPMAMSSLVIVTWHAFSRPSLDMQTVMVVLCRHARCVTMKQE